MRAKLIVLFLLLVPVQGFAQDTTTTTTVETSDPAPRAETPQEPVPSALGPKSPNRALRRGGIVGLGPFVGNMVGISLRIWPSWQHAITLDIGAPFAANSVGAALTYNLGVLIRGTRGGPVAFVGSIGLGPRVLAWYRGNASPWYVEIGGRLPIGASLVFRDLPIEINIEAGPFLGGALGASSGFAASADGKAALRFYF